MTKDLHLTEESVQFGESGALVGVLTRPLDAHANPKSPAFLILNSGIAHRVGTGRLYVRMARYLAARGYMCLRFDFSGVGDSLVRTDGLPFEEGFVHDTREAMNYLQKSEGIERFVLTGICKGGDVSFYTATRDERVAGIVLMNHTFTYGEEFWQQVRTRSAARFIWRKALFSPAHWRSLLRGKVRLKKVAAPVRYLLKATTGLRSEASQSVAGHIEDLRDLVKRRTLLLLVYSEFDPGLDAFRLVVEPSLRNLKSTESMRLEVIQASDHTFTLVDSQQRLLSVVGDWTGTLRTPGAPALHSEMEIMRA